MKRTVHVEIGEIEYAVEVEFELARQIDCRGWIAGGRVVTQDFWTGGYVIDGEIEIVGFNPPVPQDLVPQVTAEAIRTVEKKIEMRDFP